MLGVADFAGHMGDVVSSIRGMCLAYICIYWVHGGEDGYQYPAYGSAAIWDWQWMWPLLLRNLIATYVICGFWDWLLFFSPLRDHFRPFKIIPEYPTLKQIKHDAFWTTTATFCGTGLEWFMCHMMATGALKFDHDMSEKP